MHSYLVLEGGPTLILGEEIYEASHDFIFPLKNVCSRWACCKVKLVYIFTIYMVNSLSFSCVSPRLIQIYLEEEIAFSLSPLGLT